MASLESLLGEAFVDRIGFILPPQAFRHVLQKSPEVVTVAVGLRSGEISEHDVRAFVATMLNGFVPGTHFSGEVALAALAVAMERWDTAFAEEYLHDLARVARSELCTAIRVARECLKARYALPKNEIRTMHYPQPVGPVRYRPRMMSHYRSHPIIPRTSGRIRSARYSEARKCHS